MSSAEFHNGDRPPACQSTNAPALVPTTTIVVIAKVQGESLHQA